MKADKELVLKIRELLDRLANSRRLSNDEQEEVHDAVMRETKQLRQDGFLTALDSAVGKDKSRRRESVYLLSEFAHLPEVQVRIGEELKNPDPKHRHCLVQVIGHQELHQFAYALKPIIEDDPDIMCRRAALWSAGHLRAESCLSALLKLAENPPKELRSAVTWAMKDFASPNSRGYFQRILQEVSAEKEERIVAAWGVAKLGDKQALVFLSKMMFDPDERTPLSFTPGKSLRAAQAVCDIKGWSFQWSKPFVESHREEWQKKVLADLN